MRLKDRVAIITGAGRGIGRVAALTFAREGARVVIADINLDGAKSVAEEVRKAGGQAFPYQIDVTKNESVELLVKETIAWAGRIDVLVNNAGIVKDARAQKMTDEQWDSVIAVNLSGVWRCTRAVVPHMISEGSGSIINTSSVVGLYGNFGQSNYAASKGGIISMTKTWAREFGSQGIRVNAVAPGFTETEMLQSVPEKVLDTVRAHTALKRLGKPEDIANAYLFLASDESSYITGTVLSVDGGYVM